MARDAGRLKPCPACGKQNGELVKSEGARFPFAVQCRTCGWTPDFVKVPGIAVKLWNEAERKRRLFCSAGSTSSVHNSRMAGPHRKE
jgi:uncharacterized Zn finger protein